MYGLWINLITPTNPSKFKLNKMRHSLITQLFILGLLFSGCKLTKDTSVPKDIVPVTYRNETTADTTNIATIKWKEFFSNELLQKLIDTTLAHNYDMQTALKNIDAAKLVVKQSRLGNLPGVNLQATGNINRPSDNSLNGLSLGQFLGKSHVEDYTISTSVSWEADIWGKIKNQKTKALAAYLQTEEARKLIQTNLVSEVAKSYYTLLTLDAQVEIARKNLLLNDSTINIIKLQYEAGEVTLLAVQQAEAQRLVAKQLIPKLEADIAIRENAISILAGLAPAAIRRSGAVADTQLPDKISTGIPSQLLANRPDVKTRELELNIANANTGIARANMYPNLTITASGGINSFKLSNWFNIPAALFATAAGSIAKPVFQRKQLKTQYELAKIEREKKVIIFRQAVLNAVGEVSDALVKVDKIKEQQDISANRVRTLQQATGNADLLFRNGMATYLEVITAQANVLQSELELTNLRNEQINANIELYRSLGGGWN